jgi:uncharacterized membrane protein (UPF0127 family)
MQNLTGNWHWFIILLFAGLLTACGGDKKGSDSPNLAGRSVAFTDGSLRFLSTSDVEEPVAEIDIAIADEESERNEGLMDVTQMPQSAGMLFLFPNAQPRSFWMANTPLPLDIIFVGPDKQILKIHHQTKPFSQQQYATDQDAQYVVETNGGFCAAHDIHEGMFIEFSRP